MKKIISKLTAVILLICMIAGNIPTGVVYGAESGQTGSGQTTVSDESEGNAEPDGQTEAEDNSSVSQGDEAGEAQASENETPDVSEETQESKVENSAVQSEEKEQATEEQPEEIDTYSEEQNDLHYIYIESPYLQTPGIQRIVFSFENAFENYEGISITVMNTEGVQEDWALSRNVDNLYLFEKEFDDETSTGVYEVISFNVERNGAVERIDADAIETEAQFGVNQEYQGIEELAPIDEEQAAEAADVDASVVTIDENGVTEAQDSIASALEEAGASTPSTFSDISGRSGNIVVALDPGHDSTHAGASAFGLREEDLTLKIANYCKEELETYAGVSVFMTRTSSACPHPGGSSGSDIAERAAAAAAAGAKIYVSFHLNSSTASSAAGAEVIIPNNNWKPQVGQDGRALAEQIMTELTKLGLSNRGIYSKDTTINERYPDGSLSDYFAVQIYNKENGIPGIIVEHAFISNSSDVNRFLASESGLKQLGAADAAGIAKYLGLSKMGTKVSVKEGTYMIQSALGSDKVVEVPSASQNAVSIALGSKDERKSSQRFEIVSTGDGYYNIIAEHSGKALEVKGGSSAAGTTIQQNTLNRNSMAQKWCFMSAGDGYYYLCSALGTYMDVQSAVNSSGTPVWTYTFNGSTAQKWKLTESDYHPIANGTYTLGNGLNTDLVLDVDSASQADYANIQLYTSNNTSAQRFEITYAGGGYYKIIAEHSGKALDILNASNAGGANVQQYTWNGSDAQLWKFVDAGNGMYYVRSKLGTVLGLSTESAAAGTNVCMQNMSQTNSKKWRITESENRPIKDGKYVISNILSEYQVLCVKNGNVELGTYAGTEEQIFNISYVGNGYYKIISAATSKAFDVYSGLAAAGTNLREWTWNGSDAQLWKFIDNGDGSFYIKSKLGTVIDVSGGVIQSGRNVQMYTMNGSSAQKWKLDSERTSGNTLKIENGTYTIKNSTNTKQVLDVNSALTGNGANVQTYASNNTSAQRFEVLYVGEGYYQILAEHSGKALDILNASTSSGANVQQYDQNGSDAQLWRFIDAGNGSVYIQSKLGTILDINGAAAASGSNVQMSSSMGTKQSQKWVLEKSEYRPVEDGLYSLHSAVHTEYAVDIANASKADNANAWLYYYNGSEPQQFEAEYVGNGYYKLTAKHSGMVLECDSSTYKAGANVRQGVWDGSDGQLWKFVSAGNSSYYVKSKTGTVLDINSAVYAAGTNVQTYKANGTDAQKWKLNKEYERVDIEEGVYTIQTSLNKERVLDIPGASSANGANVQIYTSNDTSAQQFKITAVRDGYYKIENMSSGKVLDIANASRASGANVQQYTWNNSDAQLWRFLDAGNGKYFIQSKLGTVLDLLNAVTTPGNNVQAYELNLSDAQKWVLRSEELLYRIMGETSVTVSQMVSFYKDNAKVSYPYSKTDVPTIDEFCKIYIEECEAEGVKAEVAFAQAMMETAFLRFGGDVDKDQYNFAGLGAVGNGVQGESFKDIRTGIRAQVQHLKAYASTEPLKLEQVDKRFGCVKRGVAEYVEWLGMQENPNSTDSVKYGWASAKNYGYNIVNLYITPMKEY